VGAAGAVGLQLAELIGERNVLGANLTLFGSPDGSVSEVEVGGQPTPVTPLTSVEALKDFDFVFLALPADTAAGIVAANPGPTIIDLSAASRMPGSTPIVAPGLTPRERFRELRSSKLFAPPHPAAQTIANVLNALEVRSGFVGATLILSASASGREAVSALFEQSVELLNARLELITIRKRRSTCCSRKVPPASPRRSRRKPQRCLLPLRHSQLGSHKQRRFMDAACRSCFHRRLTPRTGRSVYVQHPA
jgi:aspartate-semialdehyde dehydrogenase